jgi:zinc protease
LYLSSVKRTDPAYWKLSLLMNILGGSDSLMSTRLRHDLGLTYAAGFHQAYKWKAGMLIGYIGCKGDNTSQAIGETAKIMTGLRNDVPKKELEQKRLDALNSFIFNVDTPAALADAYARYHMRNEPLDTLERIQDAYISVSGEELVALAREFLDPKKLQVFVVGDKATNVNRQESPDVTMDQDLKAMADELGLPFEEIELR